MKYIYFYDTIIGKIGIASKDQFITNLYFSKFPHNYKEMETPLIKEASRQLNEYLKGDRRDFDLPLDYSGGTEFQKKVWEVLNKIPYGETKTYKEITYIINSINSYRAVGNANNKNPLPIFIPCHRVVGSNGKLTGYAGGLKIKEQLLKLETKKDK